MQNQDHCLFLFLIQTRDLRPLTNDYLYTGKFLHYFTKSGQLVNYYMMVLYIED